MRIVVPTNGKNGINERVSEHFGRCATYTFLDENGSVVDIVENTSEHMGGIGLPPMIMKKNKADVLLCRGIGSKAVSLCKQFGIEVYVGEAETVKEIFGLWKRKRIKKVAGGVCRSRI